MNKKSATLNVLVSAMFMDIIAGSMFMIWYFYMTPLHILFYVMKIKGVSLETILRVSTNLSTIKDMIGIVLLVIILATIEIIINVNSAVSNIENRNSKVSNWKKGIIIKNKEVSKTDTSSFRVLYEL